jgi:uncharacterized phage protein gp47/JayE
VTWTADTADKISKDLRASVASEIPGSNPYIWPNNLYVITKVFAQALRAIQLRIQWMHLQAFVSVAESDYLDLHAVDAGTSRNAPVLATGPAVAVGDDTTIIPAGTRVIRADGIAYTVQDEATIADGTATLTMVAEAAGKASNAVPGTPLPIEAPIAGLTSITVDDAGISGGLDEENDSSLRARLLDLKRNPPLGGSPGDYIRWARTMPGITRVFVQRATPDAGHVTVVAMMDETYSDGIPQAADIASLQTILETNAPASAEIHAVAPVPYPVNVQIASLDPDTPAVRDAISTELAAGFIRRAIPGDSDGELFSRSWVDEAISNAAGHVSHQLVLPAADVTVGLTTGGLPQIPVLGTVTFS